MVRARPVLAFAASATEPDADPVVSVLVEHWKRAGLVVAAVALNPTLPDETLTERFSLALLELDSRLPLVIGGFSLGARIAALAAPSTRAEALLCFGYPFHVRGEPGRRHGLSALRSVTLPTWIAQGSRDAHGNREQVRGYGPLRNVEVHWVENANHRLQTRSAAADGVPDLLANAAQAALAFLSKLRQGPSHA
jgi:predicted alpha/beta-hydrolase family hydrolase